jgi:hypothetical protein
MRGCCRSPAEEQQPTCQHDDGESAGDRKPSLDRERVGPGRRIKSVAQKAHMIGKRADPAVARFDQSKPDVGAIEPQTG